MFEPEKLGGHTAKEWATYMLSRCHGDTEWAEREAFRHSAYAYPTSDPRCRFFADVCQNLKAS